MTSESTEAVQDERRELVRESVTMALYISLSLLAVLTALPSSAAEEDARLAALVAFTAIGLVLAHAVAFRLSTRLVSRGQVGESAARQLAAQLVGGAIVTVLAVLPLLVLGPSGLPWSRGVLLVLVAGVGYAAARSVPVSRPRALVYVLLVVVVVLVVLAVKGWAGH
jgi:hypothetical protein